jgi:hypothetical protein
VRTRLFRIRRKKSFHELVPFEFREGIEDKIPFVNEEFATKMGFPRAL